MSHILVWQRNVNPRWLTLRIEMLQLFDFDEYPAKLCTAFGQLHAHYSLKREDDDDSPVVITASKDFLRRICLGMISVRKIDETLEILTQRGYLTITKPEGFYRSWSFVLNVEKLNADLQALPASVVIPGGDRPSSDKRAFRSANLPNGKLAALKINSSLKAESENTTTNNIPLPPSSESEKNEHAPEQAEEKSVEPEIVQGRDAYLAVKQALEREKGFKPKPSERVRMQEALSSKALYQDSIAPTVARFVEWARKKNSVPSPPAVCFSPWLEMMEEPPDMYFMPSLDVDSAPPRRPPASEPAPARRKPPASEPAPPSNGLPPLAKKWNEIVTAGPKVEVWAFKGKDADNLYLSLADEGFTETLDKTLKWCQAVWQAGHSKRDYVTFSWLVKLGTWAEILNGKHEYLLRPERLPVSGLRIPPVDPNFVPD